MNTKELIQPIKLIMEGASKLIVEIRLIIFLFFEKFSLANILLATFGVIPKKIVEDLLIIS